MTRKQWTPEQRKAAGDRLRAAREAKKQASMTPDMPASETVFPDNSGQPTDPGIQNVDVADLIKRIQELESARWREQAQTPVGPQAGQSGLVGTLEKYKLDPKYYPDPRERLSKEGRLQRFAFPMNYELAWNVSVSAYKTLDGINTKEPKFTLELNRVMIDEETGEPTNGRYTICRAVFHEDPEAALVVARENGVDVADYEERLFLDEMRYLRMRDWLLEAFYPPKPNQEKTNKKDMVIGGKLVEYFEINSETSETVPFNQLSTKL